MIRWVFSFGLLFVLPFGLGELRSVEWASFDQWIWMAVIYVLIFTTFFAYLFNTYALSIVSPSVVSFYIYLQPLLAASIALMIGQDQADWIKGCAAFLIFSGVYLVSRTKTV